jgi:sortase A
MTRRTQRLQRRSRGPSLPLGVAVVLITLLGGGIFAYPLAAPWIADVIQGDVVVDYQQQVDGLAPAERARLLDAARDYNANLPNGPLRDPYVINESGEAVSMDEGRADYATQLSVDPEAPMARLTIPSIDVDLPIYHGTTEEVLSKGVGHFYGSGLPIGGAGVHSVLTAHSGYVTARLFDDLDKVKIGDEFTVSVLGEILTYRVDRIDTVLPDESELLRQVPGADYVTLVTCTPRYVNTHRLLVRGVRIETPVQESDGSTTTHIVSAPDPGFPWWILIVIGPAAVSGIAIGLRRRRS